MLMNQVNTSLHHGFIEHGYCNRIASLVANRKMLEFYILCQLIFNLKFNCGQNLARGCSG